MRRRLARKSSWPIASGHCLGMLTVVCVALVLSLNPTASSAFSITDDGNNENEVHIFTISVNQMTNPSACTIIGYLA